MKNPKQLLFSLCPFKHQKRKMPFIYFVWTGKLSVISLRVEGVSESQFSLALNQLLWQQTRSFSILTKPSNLRTYALRHGVPFPLSIHRQRSTNHPQKSYPEEREWSDILHKRYSKTWHALVPQNKCKHSFLHNMDFFFFLMTPQMKQECLCWKM